MPLVYEHTVYLTVNKTDTNIVVEIWWKCRNKKNDPAPNKQTKLKRTNGKYKQTNKPRVRSHRKTFTQEFVILVLQHCKHYLKTKCLGLSFCLWLVLPESRSPARHRIIKIRLPRQPCMISHNTPSSISSVSNSRSCHRSGPEETGVCVCVRLGWYYGLRVSGRVFHSPDGRLAPFRMIETAPGDRSVDSKGHEKCFHHLN